MLQNPWYPKRVQSGCLVPIRGKRGESATCLNFFLPNSNIFYHNKTLFFQIQKFSPTSYFLYNFCWLTNFSLKSYFLYRFCSLTFLNLFINFLPYQIFDNLFQNRQKCHLGPYVAIRQYGVFKKKIGNFFLENLILILTIFANAIFEKKKKKKRNLPSSKPAKNRFWGALKPSLSLLLDGIEEEKRLLVCDGLYLTNPPPPPKNIIYI